MNKNISRDPQEILDKYSSLSKKILITFMITGAIITIVLFILGLSKNGNDTFNLLGMVMIEYDDGNPFVGLLILLIMYLVWMVIGSIFSIIISMTGDIIAHMAYFSQPADNCKPQSSTSTTQTTSAIISHEKYWDCPNCGRCNDNYLTTCKCGEKKPQ